MKKYININAPYVEKIPDIIYGSDIFDVRCIRKGEKRKSGSLVNYNSIIWQSSYPEDEDTSKCIIMFLDSLLSSKLIDYIDMMKPKSKFIIVRLPTISSDFIQEGGIGVKHMKVLCDNNINIEFWYY
jgi:hypothetical protein